MSTNIKSRNVTSKSIISSTNSFLNGTIEKRHVIFFLIYFSITSVFELTAYTSNNKMITWLASRIWMAGGAICLVTLLYYFAVAVKTEISQKNILSLIGIAVVVIWLFYLCGNMNFSDVNPDATQQAAAGINSFSAKDLDYTGRAFLGYPNRQYVLIAIPALLFGRSILTLHLGFAIPFILGIVTLYSGLREWTYRKGVNGIYAVLAVYAVFAFRFTTEYYRNFEQSILPISLTMILIGLFLQLLCRPNALCIFSLAWVGGLCSNAYTPSLATLGLLIVFMALLALTLSSAPDRLPFPIRNRDETAVILITADFQILLFLIATLLGERSDKVAALRDDVDIYSFSLKSIYEFLTDKNAVFMGCMGIMVIVYLFAALSLRLKLYDFLLSLWVLGVFIAANLMVGYTAYTTPWIMQRALVVIPVLITGMVLTWCDVVGKNKINIRKSTLAMVVIALAFVARFNFMQINQSFIYFNNVQPMKYMLKDLEKTTQKNSISHTDNFNFVLYTDNILMQNPGDYFKFLYPNANIYIGTYGSFPEDIDLSEPTIVYGDNDLNNMTPSNDIELFNYRNVRYQTVGTWYKVCIPPK